LLPDILGGIFVSKELSPEALMPSAPLPGISLLKGSAHKKEEHCG
jgi:hypothetical protein